MLSPTDCPADIVFLIDTSSSNEWENFQSQLRFIENFYRKIYHRGGLVRLSLISYSDEPKTHFYLNTYSNPEDVVTAIWTTPHLKGGSDPSKALRVAREQVFDSGYGDRTEVPNFLILLTDGVSNVNKERTVPEAELVRETGTIVFPIGVGLVGYTQELDQIATPPYDVNRYVVKNAAELSQIENKITLHLCKGIVLRIQSHCKMKPKRNYKYTHFFMISKKKNSECSCVSLKSINIFINHSLNRMKELVRNMHARSVELGHEIFFFLGFHFSTKYYQILARNVYLLHIPIAMSLYIFS